MQILQAGGKPSTAMHLPPCLYRLCVILVGLHCGPFVDLSLSSSSRLCLVFALSLACLVFWPGCFKLKLLKLRFFKMNLFKVKLLNFDV